MSEPAPRPKKPAAVAPPDDVSDALKPSFFPPGIESWDEHHPTGALTWPPSCLPWPYTEDDVRAILAALPVGSEKFIPRIVWYARRYMAGNRRRAPRRKPNIHAELKKAKGQAEALATTLASLSVESRQFLLDNRAFGGMNIGVSELMAALNRFGRNRGLKLIPSAQNNLGRPAGDWNKRLYSHLQEVWATAHNGSTPNRGWPRFRDACIEPLARRGVLRDLEERSKQHIGTKAKHFRKSRNSAN